MCGIICVISEKSFYPRHMKILSDALKHRGPDDEGYISANTKTKSVIELEGNDTHPEIKGKFPNINYFEGKANLLLGHRRLSIIDPSPRGHQPMSDEKKQAWIVFNGEIYNFIEIRDELRRKGYSFQTNTDTEVLLKSYLEWDIGCLQKFNGMWAFIIYDVRKNIIFGARDRFGVKPLYYSKLQHPEFGDLIVFSSEIKAIMKILPEKTLNHKAVFDLIGLMITEIGEDFIKEIREIKPSEAFVINLNKLDFRKWRYYSLEVNEENEKFDEKKLRIFIANIRELIFDAVRKRLRSDVPVGSCLSGGLDSSSIVCTINEILKQEKIENIGEFQNVFTAVFPGESVDESKWAEFVVKKTRTKWHKVEPKPQELNEDIQDLIYYQDIPFTSTSIYAQYRVMKLAKEAGMKVMLDGQGGDELFTGYHVSSLIYFIQTVRTKNLSEIIREIISIKNSPLNLAYIARGSFSMFIAKSGIIAEKIFLNIAASLQPLLSRLNRDFIHQNADRLKELRETIANFNLNLHLHNLMTGGGLKQLLRFEDRNSMRFQIEARTPFSDDINLIEYIFKIPWTYKIRRGWTKFLLREAMSGIIPEEIKRRKSKIGFATPEIKWFKENAKFISSEIKERKDFLKDFVKVDKILNDLEKGIIPPNLWSIFNLAVWTRLFL